MDKPKTTNIVRGQVRKAIAEMAEMDFAGHPVAKFQSAIYNEMCKNGLGKFAKYVGRISADVSYEFWLNREAADEIVTNLGISLKKTYELYVKEFGDDADQIFIDNMFQIKFTL